MKLEFFNRTDDAWEDSGNRRTTGIDFRKGRVFVHITAPTIVLAKEFAFLIGEVLPPVNLSSGCEWFISVADFINDDGDIKDEQGHGTAVAGIIAAEGNNALGVTGVMWRASLQTAFLEVD